MLSGGVDSNALQRPKRFCGAARYIGKGGPVTVVETGSRMDEVIFEELKGAGNMERHLDREPVDGRSFPAIATHRSGTSGAVPPLAPEFLRRVGGLRKALSGLAVADGAELPLDRMPTPRNHGESPRSLTARSGGRGLPFPGHLESGLPPRVALGRLTAVPMLIS